MQISSTPSSFINSYRTASSTAAPVPFGPTSSTPTCGALGANLSWTASTTGEASCASVSQAVDLSRLAQTARVKDASPAEVRETRVFSIGKSGVSEVKRRSDGGYRVEGPTATVVYWGKDASAYLASRKHFSMDTEVIIPRGTRVRVHTEGQTYEASEPGAILLGAGSEARVEVLEGEPMVIRSQNSPVWYDKLGPTGGHRNNFDELAHINAKLYNWHTHRGRFSESDLETLKASGVVREDPSDGRYVQWQAFPSSGAVRRELVNKQVAADVIDRTMPLYESARKRRFYEALSGRIKEGLLGDKLVGRLKEDGIAVQRPQASDDPFWADAIVTENDLAQELANKGYGGPEVNDVIAAWHETTRSGYDNTGLAFDCGKVVAYNLGDKINMWNGQDTEWMVNSTAYAGESQPFTVGVSYVQAKEAREHPTDFHEIRPLETLHRHPAVEARQQTEAYMVRSGRAALVTVTDRGPEVHVLEAGDMAIVEPDVVHCVAAFQGPYEHLCAQVPSAFQYGYMFKDTQDFANYGLTESGTISGAKEALSSGYSGTASLSMFQASSSTRSNEALKGDNNLGYCLAPSTPPS